jgi:hypothetical protein
LKERAKSSVSKHGRDREFAGFQTKFATVEMDIALLPPEVTRMQRGVSAINAKVGAIPARFSDCFRLSGNLRRVLWNPSGSCGGLDICDRRDDPAKALTVILE